MKVLALKAYLDIFAELGALGRGETARCVYKKHIDGVAVTASDLRCHHLSQSDVAHGGEEYLNLRCDAHAFVGELFMECHKLL